MIIKAYVKRHMFHLPMKEPELTELVCEALGKDEINKGSFGKTFPLTKIEGNENILIEKQRTNIFLLNLLLNVLSKKEKEITEEGQYNEEYIIGKLEEETELPLKSLPYEGIEEKVSSYLNPEQQTADEGEPEEFEEEKKQSDKTPHINNVRFSVDWLKGAQKDLDYLQNLKNKKKK